MVLNLDKFISDTQQEASDPQNSVWVMASAGSGKTKVLTDRYLRLLLSGANPNNILCLTYTEAGASEMSQRIYRELLNFATTDDIEQKLQDLIGNSNDNLCKTAKNLLNNILESDQRVQIQTIHSFCQSLLKIFPYEANVSAHFDIVENTALCLQEALQRVIADQQNKALVKDAVDKFYDFRKIKEYVIKLLDKATFVNDLDLYLQTNSIDNIADILAMELIDDQYSDKADSHKQLNRVIDDFYKNLDSDLYKLKDILSAIADEKSYIKKTTIVIDEILESSKCELDLCKKLSDCLKQNSNLLKAIAKEADLCNEIRNKIINIAQNKEAVDYIEKTIIIIQLAILVNREFKSYKQQNNLLDFQDLISYAKNLLTNKDYSDWVNYKLDGSFNHILLDEAQDTNPDQWQIVNSLIDDFFSSEINKKSIFIVGDDKQSIYSFQGADIDNTKKQREQLKTRSNDQMKVINFDYSFRSATKILQTVDNIFHNKDLISDYLNHKPYRKEEGLVLLWKPEIIKKDEEQKNEKEDKYKINLDFARKIAQQIQSWIVSGKTLPSQQNRAVEYRDILILFRKKSNEEGINCLSKAFRELNIPFVNNEKVHCEDSLLISDILAMANFVLLPNDDYNLACLLKSPFCNQTEQQLQYLVLASKNNYISLWQQIINNNDQLYCSLQQIIDVFYNNDLFQAFYLLLKNEQLIANFTVRFGKKTLSFIEFFLDLVQTFSNKNSNNLTKFIEYIKKYNPQISQNSEDVNAIKIMTVHSSKGLQAPIVILPNCTGMYDQNKDSFTWIYNSHAKINIPLILKTGSRGKDTKLEKIMTNKLEKDRQEENRLLYVALTRAQDELYLTGFPKKSKKTEESSEKTEAFAKDSWFDLVKSANKDLPMQELPPLLDCTTINNQNATNYNFGYFQHNRPIIKPTEQQHFYEQYLGTAMHKAFEIIGKNHWQNKQDLLLLASNCLKQYSNINIVDRDIINKTISDFLYSQLFNKVFAGKIFCEREIVSNKQIYRPDLWQEHSNKIIIIDYKSDHSPDISKYTQKLQSYTTAMQKIYANHNIATAIFWLRRLELEWH